MMTVNTFNYSELYAADVSLESHHLLSYLRNSQHFKQPKDYHCVPNTLLLT
jgi:hypothetical protein